jgi:diaminohydroxyphosphoribosylaminopyrimidine deaminase / 5-amino-6-(5-phosphoribosylamino)uracil reductase
MNLHENFMQRCLNLSEKGLGYVAPNPLVGCVIIHDKKIIGEGYHKEFGGAHAEINAINSVKNKALLKNSTLYVTLEPCSHYGKTPPCSEFIIKSKIPKVVISCVDPFTQVAGKGIEALKKAGVIIETGILQKEYEWINRRYFTFQKKHRPYIILKWAETKDGFVDIDRIENSKKITWITNESCRTLVHKWRTEEQSILIGTKTAINDNPQLTSRYWVGKNPLRIVLDKNLILPEDLHVFNNDARTLIITASKNQPLSESIKHFITKFDDKLLQNILQELYKQNILSLIVEGGAYTLNSFIKAGLWDEARVFTGNMNFEKGVKAPKISGHIFSKQKIGNSWLKVLLPF